MPRGSHFLLLRQKKVTKEEAAPTFALIRNFNRKRGAVRNSLRSNNGSLDPRFLLKLRGRIHGDPVELIFDRCAISHGSRVPQMSSRCDQQSGQSNQRNACDLFDTRTQRLSELFEIEHSHVAIATLDLSEIAPI